MKLTLQKVRVTLCRLNTRCTRKYQKVQTPMIYELKADERHVC